LRKYLHTFWAILFLFAQSGIAQSIRQPIAAIYLGLGAYSTLQTDVFSFVNNQAALVQIKNPGAGILSERRFLLAATSIYTTAIAIPAKMGNFGINLTYSGFKNFNEHQVGFAYARSLGPKVDLGIQFNHYGYRVPSYSKASTVSFELGAMVHLTRELSAGIHVYNPVGGKLGKSGAKLSSVYKVGLGYDAAEKFFVGAEIVKEENYPVNVNTGFQYQFLKQFFMRAGISTGAAGIYGGVGVGWNYFRLDISGSYHPQLGWSPGLLLIMNFKNTSPLPVLEQ
jgi:hypothetical protein